MTERLDVKFYVNAYKDINPRFTKPSAHYYSVGIKGNRLPNAGKFASLYPLFNIDIYRQENADLSKFSKEELMSHFHHYGRFECRQYTNSR